MIACLLQITAAMNVWERALLAAAVATFVLAIFERPR
jgi:hypothetical protein